MSRRWTVVPLLMSLSSALLAAPPTCPFDTVARSEQKLSPWIDKGNWLAIENQRITLQSPLNFVPAWRLPPSADHRAAPTVGFPMEELAVPDPLDGKTRSLGFLLDSRLEADGVVVLRHGQLVAERYRNGLQADRPRLLLDATRPLLSLLGAMSVNQGKFAADRSVTRYIPVLAASASLRKISIQRLLDDEERHVWNPDDLADWYRATGWSEGAAGKGVRAWLSQLNHWDKPLGEGENTLGMGTPDDDLLAWALAESNAQPLAKLFCEQLLSGARPEQEVLWLRDEQGVELANGLGLSLRDFARLGHLLVEARASRGRAKIPGWFIETLLAPSGARGSAIQGLSKGSERRYGFVHLGGAPNRVALIGSHGTSLYLDFDKRLVVATFATYPKPYTPGMVALLEQLWKAIDRSVSSAKMR